MRHERVQRAQVTDFDQIIGADLQSRRSALDSLPLLEYAAERASILVLHPDGQVHAQAILAGPSGPVAHTRTLDDQTVQAITTNRPPRFAAVTWVHHADELAEPAASLLAAWAPPLSERAEMTEEVPWSALLVAGNASS